MKSQSVEIAKEVKRSDGWWRFACGDVWFNGEDLKPSLDWALFPTCRNHSGHLVQSGTSNWHQPPYDCCTRQWESAFWSQKTIHWMLVLCSWGCICHQFCWKFWWFEFLIEFSPNFHQFWWNFWWIEETGESLSDKNITNSGDKNSFQFFFVTNFGENFGDLKKLVSF